ncbi:hypothetical protein BGX26_011927 [Mortierella sp. AD094]|nr:hypothetical protein BGX26_011927 [Mortierella sp. AD094]
MKFFAAVATLAVVAVANAQGPVFTDCANNTDFQIDHFSLSPYPVCRGKAACGTATGKLFQEITAPATLSIIAKYLGATVYTDTQDLCAALVAQGTPCPVPIYATSLTACVTVKPNTPTGIHTVNYISATNGNNNVLFCKTATLTTASC